ncbi:MAG: hypothetical protein H7A00_00395 [Hahellaceae bacterium]|nr:hypothetical protein [Hahellaceae bacterium]
MPTHIQLDSSPALFSTFGRALLPKKNLHGQAQRGLTPSMPEITAHQSGILIAPDHLHHYEKLCGFQPSLYLPATYLHVLAFKMHMALITHPKFPLPLMGLVHVRNSIDQKRPVSASEMIDMTSQLGALRQTPSGTEFDIITRAFIAGQVVWEEVSTMLHRAPTTAPKAKPKVSPPALACQTFWSLSANLGRQYARLSGDYNPIHLYGLTAQLFGFKQAIIHGMYSKARSLAELDNQSQLALSSKAFNIEVQFKLPVFLPATVRFEWDQDAGKQHTQFQLMNDSGKKPHLRGRIEIN